MNLLNYFLEIIILAQLCYFRLADADAYFSKPMHEVSENELFVSFSESSEFLVSAASPGLQLQANDYFTHADSVRMFTGGLTEFLQSGEEEAIVPVVDTENVRNGGNKLLGFVVIKPIQPRKLLFRRGEVTWDMTEGGELPSLAAGNVVITAEGAFNKDGKPFGNPQNGGGKCISGRDCFNYNGTCTKGLCVCKSLRTGTYCQLFQADVTEISKLVREAQRKAFLDDTLKNNQKPSPSSPEPETMASSGAETVRI